MLMNILNYAHYLLESSIEKGEKVIDATCGNGHDTLFLSRVVGNTGHVLAFDIQQQAIEHTRKVLDENHYTNVSLIHDSHANVSTHLKNDNIERVGGAIFNLGYLPQSDKSIITSGDSTVAAIDQILSVLKPNGLIVLVVYHGHEGGKDEMQTVLKYSMRLPQRAYNVLQYGFINQQNDPPFIIAIQKR
ncbi:tRNA (mnm(5)s(2)U34)-methyltransferase [Oceanobacillus manasiensis]|uniref:tRNA (mnm(5)s(2)U34)-methyltransferase n=1 Tax=Oceanobacillus manasiensis TaxID=586413 RepID=UPI0005A89DEE|nr:class I SAM-dependent methyltransferase [Oceanobacillus manasiensis]